MSLLFAAEVMREDTEDAELVAASLSALCATISDHGTLPSPDAHIGARNPGPLCSDALADDSRSTLLILSLLNQPDFYVKCAKLEYFLSLHAQVWFMYFIRMSCHDL